MAQKANRYTILRDVHLIYRNFEGRKGRYNTEGDRNFCILIDSQELADRLYDEGWNVKERPPREEGDEPLRFLKVKVRFNSMYPPKLYICTKKNKTLLKESQVHELDHDEFEKVDLSISPYDRDGMRSAYLREAYFTVVEDELAEEYNERYSRNDGFMSDVDMEDDIDGLPFN